MQQKQLGEQNQIIISQKLQTIYNNFSKLNQIDSTWEKYEEKDTYKNHFKLDQNNNLTICRGEIILDFPQQTVITAIRDYSILKELDSDIKEAKQLKQYSKEMDTWYLRYKGMIGVDDRDIVGSSQQFATSDSTIFVSSSIVDPIQPEIKGVVRAEILYQIYKITPLSNKKCHITYICQYDLKGNIPAFIKKQEAKKAAQILLNLKKKLQANV